MRPLSFIFMVCFASVSQANWGVPIILHEGEAAEVNGSSFRLLESNDQGTVLVEFRGRTRYTLTPKTYVYMTYDDQIIFGVYIQSSAESYGIFIFAPPPNPGVQAGEHFVRYFSNILNPPTPTPTIRPTPVPTRSPKVQRRSVLPSPTPAATPEPTSTPSPTPQIVSVSDIFQPYDEILSDTNSFPSVESSTYKANYCVTRQDIPGDPGYEFTIVMLQPGWQDLIFETQELAPSQERDFSMRVANPNTHAFFFCIFARDYYNELTQTKWREILPGEVLRITLDTRAVNQPKSYGFKVATDEKAGDPVITGKPFRVQILPWVELPSNLYEAELDILQGKCSVDRYNKLFHDGPELYRFRTYVVAGLYAWELGLIDYRWRITAKESFKLATQYKGNPFAVYPNHWMTSAKLAWQEVAGGGEK